MSTPPLDPSDDQIWLDDEGRAMIVNSHHYTAENIGALISELKRLEDPQQTTLGDWNNKDWRTWSGILWRVLAALATDVPLAPPSATGAPDDHSYNHVPLKIVGHVQVVGIPAADDVRTALVDAYALPPFNRYGDQIKIQRVRQIEGPDLWAVRYQSEVLSRAGEWEWEPMPSSRDDAFIARCRFDSADEAIKAGEAARRALKGKT